MAEGWGRALKGELGTFYSAGIKKHGLNSDAVTAMKEVGVDISAHHSKTLADLKGINFDVVFTVCGHANETCPLFPGKVRKIHMGFDDPPKLAAGAETETERLAPYRRVRDEIRGVVEQLDVYLP